ncbi:uncharacterized protein LOC106013353 [Aplysia californica]|uniref:Uncharacterized protein LOC101859647 n=1 Tax=Aplysia californica TaxID=6500 RepID=A0ABM1AB30_APLCA|nr:uncharacterized protein LOC101859647 [Aplysia californica]XP_012944302.2 uncharacterized protein LOC106013353 [Aplysia californica]
MENCEDEAKGRGSKGSIKLKRQTGKSASVKTKKRDSKTKREEVQRSHSEEPIEMLTPKQNGYVEEDGGEESEEKQKQTASIKGMWKKAFKSLKSNDKQTWLSKKGSLIKKKEEEPEEVPQETSKEIDPVYSLLKCAADLPKVPKAQKDIPCSGHLGGRGDSSGSTSKASSPSSSGTNAPPSYTSQCSIDHSGTASIGSHAHNSHATPSGGGSSVVSNREHMHHIVDESMGSEFRTFYKLTSPVRKLPSHHYPSYDPKKHSTGTSFDHY